MTRKKAPMENGNKSLWSAQTAFEVTTEQFMTDLLPRVIHNVQCKIEEASQGINTESRKPEFCVNVGSLLEDEPSVLRSVLNKRLTDAGYAVEWIPASGEDPLVFRIWWDKANTDRAGGEK